MRSDNYTREFLKELLVKRFLKFNHPKYHKYAEQWAENTINCPDTNIEYYVKESTRYV